MADCLNLKNSLKCNVCGVTELWTFSFPTWVLLAFYLNKICSAYIHTVSTKATDIYQDSCPNKFPRSFTIFLIPSKSIASEHNRHLTTASSVLGLQCARFCQEKKPKETNRKPGSSKNIKRKQKHFS